MIRVRTLGQCLIQIDSVPIGPDAEMVFAALLLLAVEPGKRLGRAGMLGMLWPNAPGSRAAHRLRQTIYRLRTLGVPLEAGRVQLSLPPAAVDCDVDVLLRMRRADDAERVADAIGGPFLPGYAPSFSEAMLDWVERHRDLVTAGARRVLVAAIAAKKARAEWADVERLAHQCLAIDPLNEDATLALAEAAALHGGKAEAMGILDRYLREMGPTARELRLPAIALRRRIAEPELEFPLAPPLQVPFVGRSAEMATLAAALRSARAGAGSVHFIHGEPGIGKTRLLTEFSRAASLDGARIAATLCQSSDTRRPLSAFVDLVPKLMTMPGALGCSPQSHKYLRRLIEHQSSESPPTPDAAEAAILYSNVRRSLFDLLDAIASETVLILTVEDAQWLDSSSWEIIVEIAPWLITRRIIVIVTSREREPHACGPAVFRPNHLRPSWLAPLTRSASERLFDALVGTSGSASQAFRDWCVKMSGGNPYYLSELTLHGVANHDVFKVPPSLSTLVGQRVAHLRPVSCRVLQSCAILGKDATVDRVERMLSQQRVDLLDALDELEGHALIECDGTHIVNRHDLLSQAAIARLSEVSRKLLHQHAARVLESELTPTSSATLAWSSAEHWTLAGAPQRGLALICKCARHAIELGQPDSAVDLLRQTKNLSLLPTARLDVVTELMYAYRAADRWEDATREFVELRSLRKECRGEAVVHDDTELIGIESQWLGGFATNEIVGQLIECCRSRQAHSLHRIAAAKLCFIISDNARDSSTANDAFHLVEGELQVVDRQSVERLEARLIFETSFGDRVAARKTLDALVESTNASLPRERCFGLILAAHACERLGMVHRVSELATEAYRLALECSCGTGAGAAARKLAWAYLDDGDQARAEHWYELAAGWVEKGQLSSFRADLCGLRAELLIARGDFTAAGEALKESVMAWRRTLHPRWRLGVLSAKCAIWLATGQETRCHAALSEYRELLTPLYSEEGNDTLAARYFLLLARLDRRDEARAELRRYLSSRNKSPEEYGAALKAVILEFSLAATNSTLPSACLPSEAFRQCQ